jgi:hypothetical protein
LYDSSFHSLIAHNGISTLNKLDVAQIGENNVHDFELRLFAH